MNIDQVIKDFRNRSTFSSDGEVQLFRHLALSIVANANGLFIDETHGRVAQVEFTSLINGLEHCEISDLLIVVKHTAKKLYRATFWQAKKERRPRWPIMGGTGNFDFEAQFNQWELLSQRPQVKGMTTFRPPIDLLSGASSPSIGSFGAFFEYNGKVEVNYSVAEMVSSSSVTKHPRMVINGYLAKYQAWNSEVLVRNDLRSFLESINDFAVGAIIDPASTSGRWLAGYIASKCVANNHDSFIDKNDFDGPLINEDVGQNRDGDGISILMIATESDLIIG